MAKRQPVEEVTVAEAEAEEGDKVRSPRTSKFAELYPADAKLKVLVEENPKKAGSKSAERFEHYFGSKTVGEFLEKGGTYQDLMYDLARNRVEVG